MAKGIAHKADELLVVAAWIGTKKRRRAMRIALEDEVSGRLMLGPTKTHAMRKLPLPPSLAAAFERHLDERVQAATDALLFTSPKGKPLRYGNFMRTVWKPALIDLGLPGVGIHVLRHSAAAALIQTGASPTAVQRILGHRSAAFTLTPASWPRRGGSPGRRSALDGINLQSRPMTAFTLRM